MSQRLSAARCCQFRQIRFSICQIPGILRIDLERCPNLLTGISGGNDPRSGLFFDAHGLAGVPSVGCRTEPLSQFLESTWTWEVSLTLKSRIRRWSCWEDDKDNWKVEAFPQVSDGGFNAGQ